MSERNPMHALIDMAQRVANDNKLPGGIVDWAAFVYGRLNGSRSATVTRQDLNLLSDLIVDYEHGLYLVAQALARDSDLSGMTYPVTCPWCAEKGRYTVVRYSTVEGSTGICPACNKVWRAEAGLPPIQEDSDVETQKQTD